MKTYTRNIFRDPDIGDMIKTEANDFLRVVRVTHGEAGSKVHVRVNLDKAHTRTMSLGTWREYESISTVVIDGGKREGFTAN